jgi:hypothetical protein
MNIVTKRRMRRWLPTALAAAALAVGASGLIDPALAGAAPPVTTTPAPPPVHGSGPGLAKKTPPKQVLCTSTALDGTINFYLPGETDGPQGNFICGADGQWHLLAAT